MPTFTYTTSDACTTASTYVIVNTSTSSTGSFTWYNYPSPGIVMQNVTAAEEVQESAEERQQRIIRTYEERERLAREQVRTTEQYQTAKRRATRLLESCLTPEQWQSLCDKEYFEVISKDGKRRYAIFRGHMGNVYRMEKGKAVARLCRHPWGVPDEDAMLAQKLELEHNYEQFEQGANVHPLDYYRLRTSGLAA